MTFASVVVPGHPSTPRLHNVTCNTIQVDEDDEDGNIGDNSHGKRKASFAAPLLQLKAI